MEAALSASLVAGAIVNLVSAWGFFVTPNKAALKLGMSIKSDSASKEADGLVIILQLVGVCLVALAMFYLLTAIGPLQQPWNVVVAGLARLTGVAFYGWTLLKAGGPKSFKLFLLLNLVLASAHLGLLLGSQTGLESLNAAWNSFHWVSYLHR